jgi:hypothetical protein
MGRTGVSPFGLRTHYILAFTLPELACEVPIGFQPLLASSRQIRFSTASLSVEYIQWKDTHHGTSCSSLYPFVFHSFRWSVFQLLRASLSLHDPQSRIILSLISHYTTHLWTDTSFSRCFSPPPQHVSIRSRYPFRPSRTCKVELQVCCSYL